MTEAQLHEAVEALKADAFGEAAHLAKVATTGSTISETTRMSVPLLNPEMLRNMAPAWSEYRNMIEQLIKQDLEQSWKCPGRDDLRCCQATPNQMCFPKWVEREDPEWYARAIHLGLSLVNDRIRQSGPAVTALVADDAFELGCLFTEALIKFAWDKHAKRGLTVLQGARDGGKGLRAANPLRQSTEATVAAVDQRLADGHSKKAAYGLVASQQGMSDQTIRKEYRRAKKER